MKKILTITLSLVLFVGLVNAQSLKSWETEAQNAYTSKNYAKALATYQVILDDAERESPENFFKAAQSARLFRVYPLAEKYYQRLAYGEQADDFPLATYWLADVKKRMGKYDEAKTEYESFISKYSTAQPDYVSKAQKEIADCVWAKEVMMTPDDRPIIQLDQGINTTFSEFSPVEHDGVLYYSSFYQKAVDPDEVVTENILPVSRIFNSTDNMPGKLIEGKVNEADKHTAHFTFAEEGQRVYYTSCSNFNSAEVVCKIMTRAKKDNGKWTSAEELPDYINLEGYTTTHPNIGVDEDSGRELLFFSSNRPEGKGGKDLWCSIRGDDGKWSNPINLPEFNTEQDDITPFFHTASQQLYYSSNGMQNMGGFDVYKSKKEGASNWTAPEHLGYPINTSYDDLYFSVNEKGVKGYFASNRVGSLCADSLGECTLCNDIYMVDMPIVIDLLATTFNVANGEALNGVTVQLIEISSNGEIKKINLEGNDFSFPLELEKEYMLIASKDGDVFDGADWISDTIRFDTKGITESMTIEKELNLTPRIELDVYTYYKLLDQPALGVKVDVENLKTKNINSDIKMESNLFHYSLDFDTDYSISGTKDHSNIKSNDLVSTDFAETSTVGIFEPTLLKENLYFEPALYSFPLLPLYFDNDEPNKRTTKDISTIDYKESYDAYYTGRKQEFLDAFSTSAEKQKVDVFFEEKVKFGYQRLQEFFVALQTVLEADQKVEITLKGYASPRARTDYNYHLTKRRVDAVRKYFSSQVGFQKYLANGNLIISEEHLGETKAKGGSDNLRDLVNSIYSVEASEERRVEIIRVESSEAIDPSSSE